MKAMSIPRCRRSARSARGRIWSGDTVLGVLSSTRKFNISISPGAADMVLFSVYRRARTRFSDASRRVLTRRRTLRGLARRKEGLRDQHRHHREQKQCVQECRHSPAKPRLPARESITGARYKGAEALLRHVA